MSAPASPEPHRRKYSNVATVFQSLVPHNRAAFVTVNRTVSWADWLRSVDHLAHACAPLRRSRIGLLMRPSDRSYAFLVALSLVDCEVFLLDGRATSQEIDEIAKSSQFDRVIDPDREIEPDAAGKPGVSRRGAIRQKPGSRFSPRVAPDVRRLFPTGGIL
jgi:acyl-CoA synthetase (AMP-forming)/AMP-acid ligase II